MKSIMIYQALLRFFFFFFFGIILQNARQATMLVHCCINIYHIPGDQYVMNNKTCDPYLICSTCSSVLSKLFFKQMLLQLEDKNSILSLPKSNLFHNGQNMTVYASYCRVKV